MSVHTQVYEQVTYMQNVMCATTYSAHIGPFACSKRTPAQLGDLQIDIDMFIGYDRSSASTHTRVSIAYINKASSYIHA